MYTSNFITFFVHRAIYYALHFHSISLLSPFPKLNFPLVLQCIRRVMKIGWKMSQIPWLMLLRTNWLSFVHAVQLPSNLNICWLDFQVKAFRYYLVSAPIQIAVLVSSNYTRIEVNVSSHFGLNFTLCRSHIENDTVRGKCRTSVLQVLIGLFSQTRTGRPCVLCLKLHWKWKKVADNVDFWKWSSEALKDCLELLLVSKIDLQGDQGRCQIRTGKFWRPITAKLTSTVSQLSNLMCECSVRSFCRIISRCGLRKSPTQKLSSIYIQKVITKIRWHAMTVSSN